MAFRPTITVVVIEIRKPRDWEPPRPPPIVSPHFQQQLNKIAETVQANKKALQSITKK